MASLRLAFRRAGWLAAAALAMSSCTSAAPASPPSPDESTVMLLAAGDVAACDSEGDEATAEILAQYPEATIALLGDLVYPAASPDTIEECYMPTWGQFLDRTRPTLGHHDVRDDDGQTYFDLFGDRAGEHGEGWYAYELGNWHVIVLNSLCGYWAGCREGTVQHDWLVEQLQASDARCTLAYWHSPRFSSGMHGDYDTVDDLWRTLDEAGADLVLAGHDHNYERFAPMAGDGSPDPEGITQFVVGTGGKEHREAGPPQPNSEVLIDDAFGVLVLSLHSDGYDFEFVTTEGDVADSGSGACH